MALERPVILAATPPTPNGPLHLGHLSGPYVVADVAARAARARGRPVLTMCGVDPHQNYVLAKGLVEDRPAEDVARDYGQQIRAAFGSARVRYDIFVDPWEQPDYAPAVVALLGAALADDRVAVDKVALGTCGDCGRVLHHAYVVGSCPVCGAGSGGGTCEGCGAFTTALNLGDALCTRCGGSPRAEPLQVPTIRLEDYRAQLVAAWSNADLPPRIWRLIRYYLAEGLPEVPLAYPTDWGIDLTASGLDGCRMDVWVEMGLGYGYAIARALDPAVTPPAIAPAWEGVDGVWFFHGIDNAFYYAILFPALFAAMGLPPDALAGITVNEFYRLTGSKFSTSRDHAVWAHDFLRTEDPALARLYLCWDRPDRYESDFTPGSYRAFCDWVGPLLAGNGAGGLPAELARADVHRAEHALDLAGFDPALAVRCLLGAVSADPAAARPLLSLITGDRSDPDGTSEP